MTGFAELAVASNFSFLRGASHPWELVASAAALGLDAVGIADRNTLAGAVRAHVAAREHGIRLVVGARLVLEDGFETLCLPTDRAAYGRLARLLTRGSRRAPKGRCRLTLDDVRDFGEGQVFVVLPPYGRVEAVAPGLARLAGDFPGSTYLAATLPRRGDDRRRLARLRALAAAHGTPLVATSDVLYHAPARRPLQDVLTCIREHCTIDQAGFRLEANAERHLKPADEMRRLFAGCPEAVDRSLEIVTRCRFSLDELAYEYPDEPAGESASPQAELERLTWQGAAERLPAMTDALRATIRRELALIAAKNYAPYFLTVYDIVRFARSLDPPILCQGRGSAANSAVCFCLGITAVNPTEVDLLFERFISEDRDEPPDIDVDFEHERREEVIQYIYAKYGRHRAGLAATVISYRTRSAIREVGKAMGLSPDVVGALAGTVWGWSSDGLGEKQVADAGLDPADPRLAQALRLARELMGFPRHLSQHVGGFVITRGPLEELVPIANAAMPDRTFVEWDKDDLDALGILKIDVLALGMLTCLRKGFDLLRDRYGRDLGLARVPREDPRVYAMIQKADTVGVFQIESRAQMSMLPRLRPASFYDLVIEIAIVRPGPIQGDMVHPYLRRRQGLEPVQELSPALDAVLRKTLGVPLFQEQAMKIAIVGAGFAPSEADRLRRAMATFRRNGDIGSFRDRFVAGMARNGYPRDFAEACFRQIEGFSDYGFPESHSASFALLAYASSWMKCHYPDVFTCAILNAQPMGFYSASTLVRDFREHGGEVRPVDVNHSRWDHTLEPTGHRGAATAEGGGRFALRLGLRQVDGLGETAGRRLEAVRGAGFDSVRDVYFRTGLPLRALTRLADADAFRSLGLDRRAALWAVRGLGGPVDGSGSGRGAVEDLPLFASPGDGPVAVFQDEAEVALPAMPLGEHVVEDYRALSLSLKAHPVAFLRPRLTARRVVPAAALPERPAARPVRVAGLVLVRQRPATASGVIFMTLEDETGIANVIVWPKVFEAWRRTVLAGRLVVAEGMLQKEQEVIHVVVRRFEDLSVELFDVLAEPDPAAPPRPASSRPPVRPDGNPRKHPRDVRVLPKGRNFQ
ncbi:error-prone DNA polymerase [Thalassobaculum fulvum]|uniref:Error-prone DNA polymerase n=1 Tax=Thalassobaculum fulvum TaxID=1633335 RepID=A0A918XQL0_9PROT|nr:error-prone DNA polymerase [Thalassobaculum fulvum]GHD44559.1 error-prone DNA polymerase [Thalassobaculum fulvum]